MSSKAFLSIIAKRRSCYLLGADSTISVAQIQEIIQDTIIHVPSAFNSQTVRVVLLVGDEHRALWDITHEAVRGVAPAEVFPATEKKLKDFKAAYGTVLFFDDRQTISEFADKFPLYAEKLPTWAIQSNAMHQFAIWTALEAEGLGANLQHYNPLIDAKVAAKWKVPKSWQLNAQMVFGKPTGAPNPKTTKPVEDRFLTVGS